jgi:fucose permease
MSPHAEAFARTRSSLTIVACYATMFMLGVTIALLGPSLPGLAQRSSLELDEAGFLFTLFSGGSVLATLLVARYMDRPVRHQLVVAGSFLLAFALYWTSASQHALHVMAAISLSGLALSIVGTAPNAIIADAFRNRSGQALNTLHVAAGAGSFFGPLLVGVGIRAGRGYALAYQLAGAAMLVIALIWLACLPPSPRPVSRPLEQDGRAAPWAVLGLLLAMGFLYTGSEQTIGGWLYTFATLAVGVAPSGASAITAVFWGCVLVGRLAASRALAKMSNARLVAVSLTLAILGMVCLVGSVHASFILWPGVALVGLGFGPVFPTLLALAAQTFSGRAGMSSSLTIASGSAGAMLLPWAGGALIPTIGILGSMAGIIAPLLVMLGLLRCFTRIRSPL